jgi:hypothetical protein
MADRAKLLAAGEPLPGAAPFTLYRGVAGNTSARRVRGIGISWTGNLETAVWFANRFKLAKPAVHKAEVEAAQVLAYLGGDGSEDEYIALLPRSTRVVKVV